jgi:hypothetical protein
MVVSINQKMNFFFTRTKRICFVDNGGKYKVACITTDLFFFNEFNELEIHNSIEKLWKSLVSITQTFPISHFLIF